MVCRFTSAGAVAARDGRGYAESQETDVALAGEASGLMQNVSGLKPSPLLPLNVKKDRFFFALQMNIKGIDRLVAALNTPGNERLAANFPFDQV